ncbi:MAG: methyltransferase [Candidatus Aenigmarchaeota archaeon]|nr:methyltransferase [Candidatus Aenigmarchaeota archaeon]
MAKDNAEFFSLENLDLNVLKDLKKKLIEYDYNENEIKVKLKLSGPYLKLDPLSYPLLKYLVNTNKPFDILVSLFFLGIKVKVDKIFKAFTKDEIKKLSKMNILKVYPKNKNVVSKVRIFPFKNFFFFFDSTIDIKSVYIIGDDSYYLAKAIPEIKFDSALDLGCGSGIHSIIASRFCNNVTGIDINPRAINFSKFNAIFNGIENVNFRLGDLYNTIGNKKFDIIISNCPFVATPYENFKILFRDSGKLGEYHIKRVIKGIAQHLKENGIFLAITEIKRREGMTSNDVTKNLLGNNKFKVLQIPIFYKCTCTLCYSVGHCIGNLIVHNFKKYEDEITKWYKNLEKKKIDEIVLTILCIKRDENFHFLEKHFNGQASELKRIVEDFYYS